ncbi:conserved hypothetical protein [Ralstonia solanacearum IPO1609]|uniref:Uncharacterized protein n=5 Tax=Ralstonia solanacearum TaxID=305 RepID=A0ABF7RGX5_RALSL|nr:conserved hypothetical protein [Ralstonia solanacearum IPO1609]
MSRIAKAIVLTAVTLTAASGAFAQTEWQKDHPRRAEVNQRLANQNRRIHNEVKEGEMSKAQARTLHKEDRQIRREERNMAAQNGGHITKPEQRVLNQQENKVSRQIGNRVLERRRRAPAEESPGIGQAADPTKGISGLAVPAPEGAPI